MNTEKHVLNLSYLSSILGHVLQHLPASLPATNAPERNVSPASAANPCVCFAAAAAAVATAAATLGGEGSNRERDCQRSRE